MLQVKGKWRIVRGGTVIASADTRERETHIVSYDGRLFMRINRNWFFNEGDMWICLKNISMLAALNFYDENPDLYERKKS